MTTRAELRRRGTSAVAPVISDGAISDHAPRSLSPASDEAPLTRRRARSLAKPGDSASATVIFRPAETIEVDEVEPITVEETQTTVTVEETDAVAAVPTDTGLVDVPDLSAADAPNEPATDDSTADDEIDAFDAAAKLFSFTGETPVQADEPEAAEESADVASEHIVARGGRRRTSAFRRVATASFSIGVMGIVGLLAVGMTTPSQAVAAVGTSNVTPGLGGDVSRTDGTIQAYVASDQVQNVALDRSGGYTTTTLTELASESGIRNISNFFVNNPNSAIQWPFKVGVPISYGFGMRDGTMHEGVDFTPGEGAPVQAIADGTVRIATESGGAFGVTVLIDHQIDGQLVSSRYGHMLYGSLKVKTGEKITVGTVIGNTGNTGRSFGAHTHVEILMNGTTPIDPIPWLRSHAGG